MHERIRELIKQATTQEAYYPAGCNGYPEYRSDFNKEKFAELIVKECLDIVERHEYSYHEADPLWETAQLIKQRFGVIK